MQSDTDFFVLETRLNREGNGCFGIFDGVVNNRRLFIAERFADLRLSSTIQRDDIARMSVRILSSSFALN